MGWNDYEDSFENAEASPEYENDREGSEEQVLRRNVEIPDVGWKDDIERIENPVLQDKEIEKAREIQAEEKEVDRMLEAGEIDEIGHWGIDLNKIRPKRIAASTEASLASVGLSWDKLGDLSEDYDLVVAGDIKTLDQKEKNKELIREVGVEKSQEIADQLFEEEKVDKKGYDSVSRLIRNQK